MSDVSEPGPPRPDVPQQQPYPEWVQWSWKNVHRAGGVAVLPHKDFNRPWVVAKDETARAFADAGVRLGARILDTLVLAAVAVPLIVAGVSLISDHSLVGGNLLIDLGVAWTLFFEPIMTTRYGGSAGKLAVGIRVVRQSDPMRPPNFGYSLLRWMLYLVLAITRIGGLLDVLWLLWDRPRRQCLHDKAGNTIVVTTWVG